MEEEVDGQIAFLGEKRREQVDHSRVMRVIVEVSICVGLLAIH